MPEVNIEVCRLLGIHNTDDVASVTLEIKPQGYPLLTVRRMLRGPAGLHEFVERFAVQPVVVPGTDDHEAAAQQVGAGG